ncbi:uncharacterized protein LOC129708963 isoform X1 [Leucoraja erinacea]|uniref:uncharacterized protein LOC129708963 isoform X1 n=1 Tax=Leucoraja erinaceus TaxID=7782 RepID=UPI002456E1CF|nr:uncharacterized protein LOC129708963 isoform X1 [Leucoraja erinacea]
MRKSGPGETLSRLLRRRSSPSLYSPAPSPTERVEDAMVVLSSREGVANAMVDTGTAKVKPRPTVKLAIPFVDRTGFAVPVPTVQDPGLYVKIPRTMIVAGSEGKIGMDQPSGGSQGNGVYNAADDWIPPPPINGPPPPPQPWPPHHPPPPPKGWPLQCPPNQGPPPPYELPIPPPPSVAPPPPPPPVYTSPGPQRPPGTGGSFHKAPPPTLPPSDYTLGPGLETTRGGGWLNTPRNRHPLPQHGPLPQPPPPLCPGPSPPPPPLPH